MAAEAKHQSEIGGDPGPAFEELVLRYQDTLYAYTCARELAVRHGISKSQLVEIADKPCQAVH